MTSRTEDSTRGCGSSGMVRLGVGPWKIGEEVGRTGTTKSSDVEIRDREKGSDTNTRAPAVSKLAAAVSRLTRHSFLDVLPLPSISPDLACDIRSSMSCSALRMVRYHLRRIFLGVLVTFISHFREKKGAPLRGIIQARSSALRDSIGRGIEELTVSCPSNCGHPSCSTGTSRKFWEETRERKREEYYRRSRLSGPFLEAGLDSSSTEALGHVTNYTSKEVRR